MRECGVSLLPVEGVHDFVNVLRTQAVSCYCILDEAFAGIDHEDALAPGSPPCHHDDAGGNAGTVEQVGWQADDTLMSALKMRVRMPPSAPPEQHAMRQNVPLYLCS
jgi:hypothetical protein